MLNININFSFMFHNRYISSSPPHCRNAVAAYSTKANGEKQRGRDRGEETERRNMSGGGDGTGTDRGEDKQRGETYKERRRGRDRGKETRE